MHESTRHQGASGTCIARMHASVCQGPSPSDASADVSLILLGRPPAIPVFPWSLWDWVSTGLFFPFWVRKSKPSAGHHAYIMATKGSPYKSYHYDSNLHFHFSLKKKKKGVHRTTPFLTITLPAYLLWTPAFSALGLALSIFYIHKIAFGTCILLHSMGLLCLNDPPAYRVACPDIYRIIISSLKSCHTFR